MSKLAGDFIGNMR